MNKFDLKLHSVLFNEGLETGTDKSPEKKVLDEARQEEKELKDEIENTNTRRNNESLGSSVEKVEQDEVTDKELSKQLKQLAKNKKIDFPWTDNVWKCSRAEKKLAISSAKVFQQLLDQGKLQDMLNLCKSQHGELTKDVATAWNEKLGINSKVKDIQNFYKAYQEYQKSQSSFQHLKNLMGYFCESGFENMDTLKESMSKRSQKISKKQIEEKGEKLYQLQIKEGKNGTKYYERLDKDGNPRPKDWEQRVSFEIIKERLQNENSITNMMLTLLGDFNLDGEVNSGDVGYKTGTEFADVFRRSVATKHLEDSQFDENTAVKNIVAYANKFGMNIQNVQTVDQLYKWMTNNKGYENTTKLQNFLKNLPIELTDVLANGENAGAQSLENITSALKIEEAEKKKAEEAAKQKAKEIVSAGESRLKEAIKDDNERADITQQLLTQLPGMLLDKAMGEKNGLGVGYGVPLDQIVKGMSAGFNIGIGTDGKPKFGLFVGWDRKFDLSKTTDLRTAVSTGVKLLFVPCVAASMELGQEVNKRSREHSLDAKGEHRVTLGGNVSAIPGVFSYGFSVGYENKKDKGIEKQAPNINSVLRKQSKTWVEGLKDLKPKEGTKEVTFEQKKEALKAILEKEFKNSSPEALETAANNILSIIQQFKIDEKTTAQDFDTYAQVIADVYSEQWRNAKMAGLADNKRKISGGKVGIQFIAGCVPIGTLVLKFSKYRNARTNETEHSRVARIDAQVNGTGNGKNILEDLKQREIGEEQVKKQMNEILRRYGAKYSLDYRKGKDGKPGQILVPAGVADGIGINIRVSENLKGCVKNPGIKALGGPWYQFPANATYRLLQETGGNQRSVTLNIGSDKSSSSDIMISDAEGMNKLLGDKELMGAKKLEYKDAENKGNINYEPEFINKLFTDDVKKGLKTIDSHDRRKFSQFMRTKRDAVDDFNNMVTALKDVLGDNKKYKAIKDKLSDEATSQEDKQLIIDRVMAISVDTNVHNQYGLDQNVKQRGNYYKKESMIGPNGKPIFNQLEVSRDDFIKTINNYENKPVWNVLGATAFYHRNNKEQGLAITGLGATHVFGGKTQELTGNDREKVANWLLGGEDIKGALSEEKSPQEWSNLKKVIKEKIGLPVDLSNDNLKSLLKGEEVTLDNSGKKVKVNLDAKFVFYLMGECANESVGIELGNLQVQEEHEVDDYSQGALYLNNFDGSSSVNVSRKDAAVGIFLGGQKKEQKKEEEPEYQDGSDPSDGETPDKDSDSTIPEQEGSPIEEDRGSQPSDGETPENPTDNVRTDGGKQGGDGPDTDNQGDL